MTRAGLIALVDTIDDNGVNTAAEVRNVLYEIVKSLLITGETINVQMTAVQFGLWFDGTGLGRLEYDGYALTNGQNGTINEGGTVEMMYDPTKSYAATLSTQGTPIYGTPDSVVVDHGHAWNHGVEGDDDGTGGSYEEYTLVPGSLPIGHAKNPIVREGVSGVNKNIQPSIVKVRVMKL